MDDSSHLLALMHVAAVGFSAQNTMSMLPKLALLLLFLCINGCRGDAPGKKKILSFGGNGNIGSEVLFRLINDPQDQYEIYLVSRGNWYWDTKERIAPFVTHINCDRGDEKNGNGNPLQKCPALIKLIRETDQFYSVLDFSGVYPNWISNALDVFREHDNEDGGKVRVYVYVSSDSVYEVSKEKNPKDRKSIESDAVRPENEQERKILNEADNYGDWKLGGEEVLTARLKSGSGYPFVALRFPDVIGPRDTTFRWYVYQIWLRSLRHLNGDEVPLPIPKAISGLKSSMVLVDDAARIFISVMESSSGDDMWNDSYNIALEEEFNLRDILKRMAEHLGTEDKLKFDENPRDENYFLYPSVFRGPIDISKAREKLGFTPSTADEAFRKTVQWYEDAFLTMEKEREKALSVLSSGCEKWFSFSFCNPGFPRERLNELFDSVNKELSERGNKHQEL